MSVLWPSKYTKMRFWSGLHTELQTSLGLTTLPMPCSRLERGHPSPYPQIFLARTAPTQVFYAVCYDTVPANMSVSIQDNEEYHLWQQLFSTEWTVKTFDPIRPISLPRNNNTQNNINIIRPTNEEIVLSNHIFWGCLVVNFARVRPPPVLTVAPPPDRTTNNLRQSLVRYQSINHWLIDCRDYVTWTT